MNRVEEAGRCFRALEVKSVLDVGCRDAKLKRFLPGAVEYFGCDLVAGPGVTYVGDATNMKFDRTFDAVVALDIMEHVDSPHELFDKLFSIARSAMIVSLPNCYDLKGRWSFAMRGRLSGKYEFSPLPMQDRHRWLMGYKEILRFYQHKSAVHGAAMHAVDVRYGDTSRASLTSAMGIASRILGPSLTAESVLGVFTKKPAAG